MHEVGELYDRNEFFLPELLLSAEAMQAGASAIAPYLKHESGASARETAVIGVVEGDVHDIGKNLVAMMLEVEGYVVVDLGHNVPAKRFFEEAEERNARVVGLSTMMTTTLPFMRDTIKLVRTMESNPLIIVGGAPLSEALARELGADGYGENAAKAPELVESLIK